MKIKINFIASKETKIIPILNKDFVLPVLLAKCGTSFNYHIVAKEYDKTIIIKQGEDYQMRAISRVTVYAFPLDGETIKLVSQIALVAAVGAFAPVALASSPFLLGFTRGILLYGGSLALNKLFPIDNNNPEDGSLNFGDKQRSNNFSPGGAVPKIYGKVLFYPTISCKTFFDPIVYKLPYDQGTVFIDGERVNFNTYADKDAILYTESYSFGRGNLLFENFFKAGKEMLPEDYFLRLAGNFFQGDTQGLKIGNSSTSMGVNSRSPKLVISKAGVPTFSKQEEIRLENSNDLIYKSKEFTFESNDNDAKGLTLIFEADSRVSDAQNFYPNPDHFLKAYERIDGVDESGFVDFNDPYGKVGVTMFNQGLTSDVATYIVRQPPNANGEIIVQAYQLKTYTYQLFQNQRYADLIRPSGLIVNFKIKNPDGDFINLPENLYKPGTSLFVKPSPEAVLDFYKNKGESHDPIFFQQNIKDEVIEEEIIQHENLRDGLVTTTSYQPTYNLMLNFNLSKVTKLIKTEYGSLEYIGGKSYRLILNNNFLRSTINRNQDVGGNIAYSGREDLNNQLQYSPASGPSSESLTRFEGITTGYKTERFRPVEIKMTVTNRAFPFINELGDFADFQGSFKLKRAFWEYCLDSTEQIKKEFPLDENNLLVSQEIEQYNEGTFSSIVTNLIKVPSNISADYSAELPENVTFRDALISDNEHRNPAYICLDMLKNAMNLNKINNSDSTDANIDYVSFEIFAKACFDKSLFCSAIFETQDNLQASLDSISFVGLAKIKKILEKWTAVLSYNYGMPSKMLTPQNSSNWSFGFPQDKKYHGVKLNYLEESNNKNKRQSNAYFQGYGIGNANNFFEINVTVSLEQVTAQKIANFYRDSLYHQKEQFTCEVDIKQLGLSFGQLVLVGGSPIVNSDIVSARVSKVRTQGGNKILSFQVGIKLEENTDYYLTVYKTTGEIFNLTDIFQATFTSVVDNIYKCSVNIKGVEVLVDGSPIEIRTKNGVQLFEEVSIVGLSDFNFEPGDIICIKKNNTSPKPFIITDIFPKDGLNSADVTLLEHTTIPETNL